jgi:phage-related protein
MYEINGVPVSEAALIARAEELNITLEELIKRNSEIIVKVGEAPLVAQAVPDGTSIDQAPLNIPESMDPALDYDPITSIQNVTPSEKEIQVRDEKIKSYDQQLKEYNKKIQDILNFPGLSGQQRLDMVNELQTPGTIDLVNEGFSDISNPFLFNESNSVEVQNEYSNNKELVSELQQKIKESNNKEEDYTNIFSESLNSDPLVDARRNFYIKNLQEKVELFKQQLIEKNVYDLTTKAGVELAQKRVNEYYAGLIDESMQSDPVVMQQADKISEMLGIVNTADQKQVARGKSLVYSLSDFGQNYYGKDSWQSDIIAGVENLAVQGQSLTSNSMDVIGAQVDGKRKRIAEEVLSQIAALENEGKGEDEEVEIRVGEKSQNFLQTVDRRPRFNGTIKELKSQMENSLQTASQSLEDNIAQMTEFEEYRALAEQAKFSDGISFRDIMVGLGGSLPQMTAASLGTIATVASGGILAPVAGALTFGGGALVTAQFYGENYIEGVKESMLADKEKYPDGITEEALGKAITSGEYDNVAQDLATAALMARLEKLGAETTMKAFFKSMGVSYKSGVKSLFRGDIKKIIKDMGKGVVKQTPNSIIEGLTEVGQSTLQALNTGTKQGDLFKYVNGENNWEEFLAGVTIGTVLPFGGAVATQTRAELRTTAMKVAKEFNPKGNLAQTEMFYKTVLADLKKQKDNGVLSEQEYQDQVEEISSIRNAGLKVPGNFSKRARGESLDLMVEKQRILKEIEGLEPELVVEQKLRIKEINKRLNNIGKAESIISANKKVANQLSDDVIDEFKTFENQEEMLAFLEENGLDPSLAEGRAVEVNIDGKEIALINTEKMTDGVSYFAGAHEILHKFLKNTFNTNPESVYQMANVVKDRLKQLKADPNTNKTLLKGLNDTLNKYKEDSKVSTRDEAEEMITLFSEFVDLGLIAKDKQLGDNLRSASRRFLQNVPGLGKIEFNNANDILNFIADYNKSIKKGRLTRAQRTAAEEGIEISEDLDASVLEADQEREQLQVEANEISSQAKDLEIEQAQQRNASAAELASLFEDDVRTYVTSGRFKIGETPVKDNPKVAGTRDFDTGQSVEGAVEIYDIVSAILYSKRGVVGLVEDYYKKSKEYRDAVTLGQFIGDSRRRDFYRATEIVAPLLGVQSEENVVEEKEDFSKEEKESLRKTMTDLAQELNFDEQSTEKAAIEQAEVESLASDMAEAASKILKGKLKAPTSKEFLKALRKSAIADLETDVKKIMGTPTSAKYTNFVETYVPAILAKAQHNIEQKIKSLLSQ